MADILFPDIKPSQSQWSLVSNTGRWTSPLTGATQTFDRSGERWRARLTFNNLTTGERALLQAFISSMNGAQNRAVLRDHSYTPQGAITSSELQVALTAANHSAAAWQSIVDLSDGIRVKREGNTANGSAIEPTTEATVTAGLSYAHRIALRAFPGLQSNGRFNYISTSSGAGDIYDEGNENHATDVRVAGFTAPTTSIDAGPTDSGSASAYSQFDILANSVSRAFLVDNGINELTYSEQFDNAAWTKASSSITANDAVAPDGSTTADLLIQAANSNAHYAFENKTKSSSREYWTLSVWAKADALDAVGIAIGDASSENSRAAIDLTDGSVDYTNTTAGQDNQFATSHDYGGGWYRVRITARMSTATTVQAQIYALQNTDSTFSETGDGSSGIHIWGAQLQQGGQLGRYVATTSAAATEDSQTGSEIWLKGLDEDTDGQLVAGDLLEIDGQLVQLTSDLDGDESGIGLATVSPRIRSAPADETAAVIYRPHGRFLLANVDNGWSSQPGQNILSNFTLEFIEDIVG